MIEINGKKYEVNLDVKLGTQLFMSKVMKDPNLYDKYIIRILRDLLIPTPTDSELVDFRRSDIFRIFNLFAEQGEELDSDFKKKLST